MIHKYKGEISLLGVSFFWGIGYAAIEIALKSGMNPLQIQALRFIIGVLCILPLVLRNKKGLTQKTVKKGILLGLMMFIFFYLLLLGQSLTNTSKTAFLTGTYVIFVPFLDWLYRKEAPGIHSIFAAILSVFGVWLMNPGGFGSLQKGDLILLLGAFFVALHMVISTQYVKDERPLHLNFIQLGVTAVLSVASALLLGSFTAMNQQSMLAIAYIGIVGTFIAYMLQTTGQKFTSANRASVLLSLEAPIGTFCGVLLFGDPLNLRMSMGYLCILLAVLVSEGLFTRLYQGRRVRDEILFRRK